MDKTNDFKKLVSDEFCYLCGDKLKTNKPNFFLKLASKLLSWKYNYVASCEKHKDHYFNFDNCVLENFALKNTEEMQSCSFDLYEQPYRFESNLNKCPYDKEKYSIKLFNSPYFIKTIGVYHIKYGIDLNYKSYQESCQLYYNPETSID